MSVENSQRLFGPLRPPAGHSIFRSIDPAPRWNWRPRALRTERDAALPETLSFLTAKEGPRFRWTPPGMFPRSATPATKPRFGQKAKMLTPDQVVESAHPPGGRRMPFWRARECRRCMLDESLRRTEPSYPACGGGNSAILPDLRRAVHLWRRQRLGGCVQRLAEIEEYVEERVFCSGPAARVLFFWRFVFWPDPIPGLFPSAPYRVAQEEAPEARAIVISGGQTGKKTAPLALRWKTAWPRDWPSTARAKPPACW